MKIKAIILVGVAAAMTLSFTFVGSKKTEKNYNATSEANASQTAPVGGFTAESIVK